MIILSSSSSSHHHHHLYHHYFHHQYFHHLHPIIIFSISIIILSSSRQTHLQIHTVRNFSWGIWSVHACAGNTCRWCSAVRTGGAAGGGAGILKRDTIYTMTETSSLNKQVEQVERYVLPQHSQSRAVAARLQGICLVAQPLQSRPRSYNRPTTMQASAQSPTKLTSHTSQKLYFSAHLFPSTHHCLGLYMNLCAL